MIVKLTINPETLEATAEDSDVIINHVKSENGLIKIEISKAEVESFSPYNITTIVSR